MEILVPQGFSRSLLSLSICGYLLYSRQKCQKFARNHPPGYPQKFRKHDGAPNILRADKKRSSSLSRGWLPASAQIDRLAGCLNRFAHASQRPKRPLPDDRIVGPGFNWAKSARRMSVSTIAGEITFAVIPTPASCDPYVCVCPIISAFDAA